MNILGIGGSECDISYCLIKDGKIVCTIEEERLSRQKHAIGTRSLFGTGKDYCLKAAGCTMEDIDLIVSNDVINPVVIRNYKDNIILINHHLAHAASSHYVSGFDDSAVLVIDGAGSEVSPNVRETISFGYAEGTKIDIFEKISGKIDYRKRSMDKVYQENSPFNEYVDNSLGSFYRWITEFCGFTIFEEGKTMGLAPYGKNAYVKELWKYVKLNPPNGLEIKMDNYELDDFVLDIMKGKSGDELFKIKADLAYAAQEILEDCMMVFLEHLYNKTQCKRLCLSGGVALNSVANGKIVERTPFREIFVQPAASDSGTAIGAALYGYYQIKGQPYSKSFAMKHAYTGRPYTDEEIVKTMEKYSEKISWRKIGHEAVCRMAAEEISKERIIGWFQGGSEIGPRALGHRSILADPRRAEMKDIINDRVKFREAFRPFAPAVMKEHAGEYFRMTVEDSPFMLMVLDVLEDKKSVIPSVTHVDGTGRVQTVTKAENDYYYDVIKNFRDITGVPVILNTSFNVKGEPIIETPEDAIKCFIGTNIDILFMEDYVIEKD